VNAIIAKVQSGNCRNDEKLNEFLIGAIPDEIVNFVNLKLAELKKSLLKELPTSSNKISGSTNDERMVTIEGKISNIEKTGLERQSHLETIVNDLLLKCKVLEYKVGNY
jgi:hypothetical protein